MTIEATCDDIKPANTILDLTTIALLSDNDQKNLIDDYIKALGAPLYVYVKDRQYMLTFDGRLCLRSTSKPPHCLDFTVFSQIEAYISPHQAKVIAVLLSKTLSSHTFQLVFTDTQRLMAAALQAYERTPTDTTNSAPQLVTSLHTAISHHKILRQVRCEIIDLCLNLINEQAGPNLSPFGSVRKLVRIHDQEVVLLIKTANSIPLANRSPLNLIQTRFSLASYAATKYKSLPKGRFIQRNASHSGLVTNDYTLSTPADARVNLYPGSPYLEFSTLAEDLHDQVNAISGWQIDDRRTNPTKSFNLGSTFAVNLRESTHTINQTMYWDVAIHSR